MPSNRNRPIRPGRRLRPTNPPPRAGRAPERRGARLAATLLVSASASVAAGCGGGGGDRGTPPPSPPPRELWTYDEVLARTADRIGEVAWPAGLEPTAQEVIGRRDEGPPSYDAGFDASRVAYDRVCAWWVSWHEAPGGREVDTHTAAGQLDGLADAVEAFAASDNPGAPIGQLRHALDQARRGDAAGLLGPAFTRSCLLGAGRWWDRGRNAGAGAIPARP